MMNINIKSYGTKNFISDNFILHSVSKRYNDVVNQLIASLDSLKIDQEVQDHVNKILIVLSKTIKQDFSMIDFIKYDYVNLHADVKKFFGGPGVLKRTLDCKDTEKMAFLISRRITYLINKLSQTLDQNSFILLDGDYEYKKNLASAFEKIILGLYNKGLRNFRSMVLYGLDLSNKVFESTNFYGSVFWDSNLENAKFIKCNLSSCGFVDSKILGLTIDKYCSLYLTDMHSKLDLLDMHVFADITKLMYTVGFNNQDMSLLLAIKQSITSGINIINDSKLEELTKTYLSMQDTVNVEHAFKVNNNEYKVVFQCPITLEKPPLSDLCGIKYNNAIRLYSANALFKWVKSNLQCPFRMPLVDIQKNILNLKDIKELLCQI